MSNEISKQIERVRFVSTLSKRRNFTINSFDIVAVFGNKVECCFDVVAGVDGALRGARSHLSKSVEKQCLSPFPVGKKRRGWPRKQVGLS